MQQQSQKIRDGVSIWNQELVNGFRDFDSGGQFHSEEINRSRTLLEKRAEIATQEHELTMQRISELQQKCEQEADTAAAAVVQFAQPHLEDLSFIENLRSKSTLQASYQLEVCSTAMHTYNVET